MNILFLTMNVFTDIEMHNIYSDLMKEFIKHGHRPYIVTPREKKMDEATELCDFSDHSILKVRIGNTSDVSLIEKGVSTVTLSEQYYRAVIKYLGKIEFSLILYSTPPITLAGPVKKLKAHFKCRTYLMLKDIFPQNAVDLGMMTTKGFMGIIYKYFRRKEKQLYKVSDRIGCMSQANIEYVLRHNPNVDKKKVEICPNSIIPHTVSSDSTQRGKIREKYGIPNTATVFMYGGNMGRPQDIPYVVECMKAVENNVDCFFILCGTGIDLPLLEKFIEEEKPNNVLVIPGLPKNDYDELLQVCDVGLIFLDHRFTIPNFPSRLLSYMDNSMPILACTDPNTDLGKVVVDGGFGWRCESNNAENFKQVIDSLMQENLIIERGAYGNKFLYAEYLTEHTYERINQCTDFV